MSLRTKFLFLVLGAILAPISVFVISYGLDADFIALKRYHRALTEYRDWRDSVTETTISVDQIKKAFTGLPDVPEVRVFNEAGDLLYWQRSAIREELQKRYLVSEIVPVTLSSDGPGAIVVTRPAGPVSWDEDRWYVPLTGIVFIAAMAIVIAQSINRSIRNLERATRRIAEGDLDFELPIKGNDKLASLTRSFDQMREHLKEEYARRSRFIMGISHDLKTPLSSINGYAHAIGEGYADTPGKLEKYIGIIEDKTSLLESRISMLIDYVSRETTDWKLKLEPVELRGFLDEVARVFESEVALEHRSLESSIGIPTDLSVPMDEDMLVRALENLLKNAISYSTEGTDIRFRCSHDDRYVTIEIENEGPGIRPEDLPHVFDPFVRGARDRKGAGLGLGLATVESVISSHGWKIDAESEPGKTTVFRITIPHPTEAIETS